MELTGADTIAASQVVMLGVAIENRWIDVHAASGVNFSLALAFATYISSSSTSRSRIKEFPTLGQLVRTYGCAVVLDFSFQERLDWFWF